MGIRAEASAFVRSVLENEDDFGCLIVVESPAHHVATVRGFSRDIGQLIDFETGIAASGRQASVTIHMATLAAAGFVDQPRPVSDPNCRPWVVRFTDSSGKTGAFAVRDVRPDNTLGVVVCTLEHFKG